jgi:hypothetical protein
VLTDAEARAVVTFCETTWYCDEETEALIARAWEKMEEAIVIPSDEATNLPS